MASSEIVKQLNSEVTASNVEEPPVKKAKVYKDGDSTDSGSDNDVDDEEIDGVDDEMVDEDYEDSDPEFVYSEHIRETEGFYVDPKIKIPSGFSIIVPLDLEDEESTICKWAYQAAYAALSSHNADRGSFEVGIC